MKKVNHLPVYQMFMIWAISCKQLTYFEFCLVHAGDYGSGEAIIFGLVDSQTCRYAVKHPNPK